MDELKEVYFNEYCSECKYEEDKEDEDPCHECLNNPVNVNSHKPVKFTPKPKKKSQ